MMGRAPFARIRLPDGVTVIGWTTAARRAGVSIEALKARAEQGPDGVWTVRPVRYVPGTGRPRNSASARIRLPDGEIVIGWAAVAERLGRSSINALMARAVKDEDGVWDLDLTERRRSPVPDAALRAAIAGAVAAGQLSRAAIVRVVRAQYPGLGEERIRLLINRDTGVGPRESLPWQRGRRRTQLAVCLVAGCGKPTHARGLCWMHYKRVLTRGRRG